MSLPRPDFTRKITPLGLMEKFKLLAFTSDIHSSASNRDWITVTKLVIHHAELNINLDELPEDCLYTVLQKAIIANKYDTVALLLEHNVNTKILSRTAKPEDALMIAIGIGAVTAIKLLILNGADYSKQPIENSERKKVITFRNSINALEFVRQQKTLAEAHLKKIDIKSAFIAYTAAGDRISSLTNDETDDYVIKHIIHHAALYYRKAVKIYCSLPSEEQANFKDTISNIKITLEKIGEKIQLPTNESNIANQTAPSTPTSDIYQVSGIKRRSSSEEHTHLLEGKSSSDDTNYDDVLDTKPNYNSNNNRYASMLTTSNRSRLQINPPLLASSSIEATLQAKKNQ